MPSFPGLGPPIVVPLDISLPSHPPSNIRPTTHSRLEPLVHGTSETAHCSVSSCALSLSSCWPSLSRCLNLQQVSLVVCRCVNPLRKEVGPQANCHFRALWSPSLSVHHVVQGWHSTIIGIAHEEDQVARRTAQPRLAALGISRCGSSCPSQLTRDHA